MRRLWCANARQCWLLSGLWAGGCRRAAPSGYGGQRAGAAHGGSGLFHFHSRGYSAVCRAAQQESLYPLPCASVHLLVGGVSSAFRNFFALVHNPIARPPVLVNALPGASHWLLHFVAGFSGEGLSGGNLQAP